jgi:hypothetical protein
MFSSFKIFFSSQNSFEGKLKEEETILVVRRHPIFLLFSLVFFLFLFILPFFLWRYFSFLIFFVVLYWSFLWIFFFYQILLYFLSVFIVTNKRVIKIETLGFFNYQRNEAFLDNIQEIKVEVKGFLASFFHFGNIEIQTAAENVRLIFNYLPSPEKIKEKILWAREKKV